jgi:hypothetical protein
MISAFVASGLEMKSTLACCRIGTSYFMQGASLSFSSARTLSASPYIG